MKEQELYNLLENTFVDIAQIKEILKYIVISYE